MAARLHVDEHFLDRGHPQLESARQVVAVNRELALDVVEQRQVVLEQRQTLVGNRGVALGERLADADRVGQLQAEAAAVVERLADELLERLEAAGGPRAGSPCLARIASRALTGNTSGAMPSSRCADDANERTTSSSSSLRWKMSTLLTTMTIFLPQSADRFEERALGLGERPVGRGDEQHQIGARHEIVGEPLVLADDGVGARRVDDVDVAKQLHRRRLTRRGRVVGTVGDACRRT